MQLNSSREHKKETQMTRINILKAQKPSWKKSLQNVKASVEFQLKQVVPWNSYQSESILDVTDNVAALSKSQLRQLD